MAKTVYYYKTSNGDFHFSTGVYRDESRAMQYIRMLKYAKMQVEPLYPDNARDYELICEHFHIKAGTPWQDIYEGRRV